MSIDVKRKQGICLAESPVIQAGNVVVKQRATATGLPLSRRESDLVHGAEMPKNEDAIRGGPTKQRDLNLVIRFPPKALDCSNGSGTKRNLSEPQEPFPYAGYAAAFLDVLMYGLCMLCIKLLPVENSLPEKSKACMIRGLIMMLLCGLQILWNGQSFRVARGEFLINLARSSLGGLNMLLTFVVLGYISLGESSAILYSNSVWTCLLSFLILREPFQLSLLAALPLSFLGIILLAKPDLIVDASNEFSPLKVEVNPTWNTSEDEKLNETDLLVPTLNQIEASYFEQRWPGFALSLASSFIMSIVIIILKLRKKTHITTCTFYLGSAMALVGLGVQLVVGFGSLPSSLLECLLHLSIGLLSFGAQCFFQWSLVYVRAANYSIIQSLDIVLGFVLGVLFLDDLVLWTSVLGSALIIVVVIMLVLNDFLVARLKSLISPN